MLPDEPGMAPSALRTSVPLLAVTLLAAPLLSGCSSDPCEEAYDALWMTRLHTDGTKSCTYLGGEGDSPYSVGGVTDLPYP